MILHGYEDLRVVKTIESIKSAFESLICEKEYNRITVKELCDRARINKKTFYRYYDTLDVLLAEIQTELMTGLMNRIRDYDLPGEIDKVNQEFFLYSAQQGRVYEKITCSMAYRFSREEMLGTVNDEGWSKSKEYQKLSAFEQKLLMGFLNHTVLNIYCQWIDEGKEIPLENVIDMTNKIIMNGVNGFFD